MPKLVPCLVVAGLTDTGVVLSNDLDEFAIKSIRDSGAKVASGAWAPVGYRLRSASAWRRIQTGGKAHEGWRMGTLCQSYGQSSKQTVPGILDVRRYFHESGTIAGDMVFDVLYPVSSERIVDPADELRQKDLSGLRYETLLEPLARAGKVVLDAEARDAMVARDRCREQSCFARRKPEAHCQPAFLSSRFGILSVLSPTRFGLASFGTFVESQVRLICFVLQVVCCWGDLEIVSRCLA